MWILVQGGDNFAREFKQLRRSFRFNEYKSISDVNPPRNFVERVSLSLHRLPVSQVIWECLLTIVKTQVFVLSVDHSKPDGDSHEQGSHSDDRINTKHYHQQY